MLNVLNKKKIAVLGMGINHARLTEYLSKKKVEFKVLDGWKDPMELYPKLKGINLVFRTPGIPYNSPLITKLRDDGVETYSQTRLFFDLCPCPIIGVTGTKGKGTVASLIYAILKRSGKKVWLAGNIGTDPFEFIDEINKDDIAVLELSSFQLQDLTKSPHVAVVLSITQDHVNPALVMATHYSLDEYVEAKLNIVRYQTKNDFAVVHPSLLDQAKNLGLAKKISIEKSLAEGIATKLVGDHNKENIAAAIAVAKLFDVGDKYIRKAVAEFEPLPHRLEMIGKYKGVEYVDDSISTNVDSTIAAIKAFSNPKILILGGYDKGHDYSILGEFIKNERTVRAVIAIGQVAERIKSSLVGFSGTVLSGAKNMKEIVEQASMLANPGDVVILSPAAASFDMFKDAKDRGSQFINEVKKRRK